MRDAQPPLEFFLTSSETALESYELSRLNRAANLRKQMRQVLEDWIEAEVSARVSRLALENRRNLVEAEHLSNLETRRATPSKGAGLTPALSDAPASFPAAPLTAAADAVAIRREIYSRRLLSFGPPVDRGEESALAEPFVRGSRMSDAQEPAAPSESPLRPAPRKTAGSAPGTLSVRGKPDPQMILHRREPVAAGAQMPFAKPPPVSKVPRMQIGRLSRRLLRAQSPKNRKRAARAWPKICPSAAGAGG